MESTFTTLLFDLDGCLLDTNRLILRSFQHTFAARADLIGGVDRIPDAATISGWFGEPLTRTFKRFTDNEADVQTLITEYRSFNAVHHDELAAEFEGIEPAIRLMYQCGFKMAIVTSKVSHVARQGLKRARIDQYFSVLIGSDSVDQHKPHPAPALAALALLNEVPGPHVLMVGDAATDILCGKAAGCKTAAVGWSTFSAESLSMADYFPSDAAALRDLIMPPWKLTSGHSFPAGAVLGTWRADSAKVRSIVRHSICQGGVRHIDTARMYFNHTQIGEGIKDAIESGMVTRQELFITSKLMPSEMHPECVAELVDASLTELQVDYLDMFLIHWPCALVRRPSAFPVPADERFGYDPQRILDVWRVLEAQVAAGKIRSLGVSNFSCTRLHESLLKHSLQCPVVCNQVEMHATHAQPELLSWHQQRGIVVTCYAPLGSPTRPPTCRPDEDGGSASAALELMQEPIVLQVAADCQRTPAQVLLRWALQRGSLPLPKTVTPERSEENGRAWHGWRLSEAQMLQLISLDRQRRFFRGDNVSLIGQPWELNWAEDASIMSL